MYNVYVYVCVLLGYLHRKNRTQLEKKNQKEHNIYKYNIKMKVQKEATFIFG